MPKGDLDFLGDDGALTAVAFVAMQFVLTQSDSPEENVTLGQRRTTERAVNLNSQHSKNKASETRTLSVRMEMNPADRRFQCIQKPGRHGRPRNGCLSKPTDSRGFLRGCTWHEKSRRQLCHLPGVCVHRGLRGTENLRD